MNLSPKQNRRKVFQMMMDKRHTSLNHKMTAFVVISSSLPWPGGMELPTLKSPGSLVVCLHKSGRFTICSVNF